MRGQIKKTGSQIDFKYHEDKKTTEYNMNNSSNKIILARDYFFILIREQKVSFTYMK